MVSAKNKIKTIAFERMAAKAKDGWSLYKIILSAKFVILMMNYNFKTIKMKSVSIHLQVQNKMYKNLGPFISLLSDNPGVRQVINHS